MKAFLFLLFISLARAGVLSAQQGVVMYEVIVNQHARLPTGRQDLKSHMPEFRYSEKRLFFSDTASICKPTAGNQDNAPIQHAKGSVQFKTPQTETYISKPLDIVITWQEFLGETYAVVDTLKAAPWKFSKETKEILGYVCKKAHYTHQQELSMIKKSLRDNSSTIEKIKSTQEIVAWYTEQLPDSLGPDRYYALPGMVLEVDINDGEQKWIARAIELRELTPDELKLPANGIKINREDYKKLIATGRMKP
jgi:GLPGLI family protein